MPVITERIRFSTRGNTDVIDITPEINAGLEKLSIKDGIVSVSVCGSTCGVTTCEYEPGLVRDIKDLFDRLVPEGGYLHDQAEGDNNGHSHLRASLTGPSVTLPFKNKKLLTGTWQQIIFIDFDVRARQREVVLQFIGE